MQRFILLLTTFILTLSCSEVKELIPSSDDSSNFSISVSTSQSSDDSSSRVSLSDNGSNGYSVSWVDGDKLGGWSSSSTQFSEFSMSEFGENSSTFEGSISGVSSTDNIRFVYPYLASSDLSGSTFSVDLSNQTSCGDLSNLSSSTYMVSNVFTYGEVGSTSVAMYHVGAVIDLQIKIGDELEGDFSLTGVEITGADGLEIPTAATIDLTQEIDAISKTTQTGTITIDTSATPIEANDSGIYALSLNTLPFDIAADQSVTVVATFENTESNTTYVGTKTITAGALVEFKRATRNGINAAVTSDELSSEPTESLVASIEYNCGIPSSYGSGSFTLDDIYFGYIYCKYSSTYIQMTPSESSAIYNTTAISGLSKIVITFNSANSSSVAITSGSTSEPTNNSIDYSSSSEDFTYTLSSDYEYFMVSASSSLPSRIDKIEVYAIQ